MGRVNTPHLSKVSREELEKLQIKSTNASLRKRCQLILLKADGRSSKDVGSILRMSHVSVNSWVKRYKEEGVLGLSIKPGRVKKGLLNLKEDKEQILESIKRHRQKVSSAKAEWELTSGKKVSEKTFKRFLKSLVEDING
jgi:transposase